MVVIPAVIFLIIITVAIVWHRIEGRIIPRQSTVAFWRLSKLPLLKRIEGYFYGARTALYLKPATFSRLIALGKDSESADSYHGKVVTGDDAVKLIAIDRPVALTNLEHVIPYSRAKDIILNGGSIAVLQCPCREQKEDSCEPRDVCLVVGEPFAGFVVDHQPGKARRISVDEALSIIEAEEERGHIHTAWFKDAMHDRFYAICNCCRCCCLGMKSFFRGVPRLAHSGYRPEVGYELCDGCAHCTEICPFGAVSVGGSGEIAVSIDKCMGCGLCVSHCPNGAMKLGHAPDKGFPLAIDMLTDD